MIESVDWPLSTCVWELTLACNAGCLHCGSSAGKARPDELTTEEALSLVDQLSELGCASVTFSGGEPLLRADWPQLARAVRRAGMDLEMITNGLCVAEQAEAVVQADFSAVTFSIDGPAAVHDELRGHPGALSRLLDGAAVLNEGGVRLGAVTQINWKNILVLSDVYDLLVRHGFAGWQVQLTMPHGRAARATAGEGRSLCLSPSELPELERMLATLQQRGELFLQAADNIGYMGRFEPQLRSGNPFGFTQAVFTGCTAGMAVVGIASNGDVRGCLSMPESLNEGNIRKRSLREIWNDSETFSYNRHFTTEQLREACAGCAFGSICRGGCTSLACATDGAPHGTSHCLQQLTRGRTPGR